MSAPLSFPENWITRIREAQPVVIPVYPFVVTDGALALGTIVVALAAVARPDPADPAGGCSLGALQLLLQFAEALLQVLLAAALPNWVRKVSLGQTPGIAPSRPLLVGSSGMQ